MKEKREEKIVFSNAFAVFFILPSLQSDVKIHSTRDEWRELPLKDEDSSHANLLPSFIRIACCSPDFSTASAIAITTSVGRRAG